MSYVTHGEVHKRATAAGLVMGRRHGGIHIRFRDPLVSDRQWEGLTAPDALEIVKQIEAEETAKSAA